MQGFNMGRYVPPDLEGTVSSNTASGKGHALGARARKLKSEGVLVVRFECPFAIWCTNCQPEQIIGQGVRFNAEKKKVGNYYSTPVWSFKIKHNICGKFIEVRTDPKNAEYVVISGGRRRDTGGDKLLDGEVRIDTGATEEEKERLERDGGFGMLEKKVEDRKEADSQKRRLEELFGRSERDWADPYEMSRRLRKEFRVGRRQRQADEKSGEALKERFGLDMELLAPEKGDTERAGLVEFGEQAGADTKAKPMFKDEETAIAKVSSIDRGKNGKKSQDVALQKDTLRHTLRGNTRNVLDPFLSDDGPTQQQQKWRPNVRRQRIDDAEHAAAKAVQTDNVIDKAESKALVGYDSDSS